MKLTFEILKYVRQNVGKHIEYNEFQKETGVCSPWWAFKKSKLRKEIGEFYEVERSNYSHHFKGGLVYIRPLNATEQENITFD